MFLNALLQLMFFSLVSNYHLILFGLVQLPMYLITCTFSEMKHFISFHELIFHLWGTRVSNTFSIILPRCTIDCRIVLQKKTAHTVFYICHEFQAKYMR